MPSEYRLTRRVQFYETDAAGIVHFTWFFRYMEEAEHALWREAGLSIHPPDAEIGWPRVAASFEFQRPLRFEDEFEVRLRIAEITRRTIRYTCVLAQGDTTIANGRSDDRLRAQAARRADEVDRHPAGDRGALSGVGDVMELVAS